MKKLFWVFLLNIDEKNIINYILYKDTHKETRKVTHKMSFY